MLICSFILYYMSILFDEFVHYRYSRYDIYIYSAIVSPEFLELSPHPGRPSRMARAARDLDAAIFRLESTGYFYGK